METETKPSNLPLGATYSEPKWVSTKGVSAVGEIINVTINSIGKSKVLKYFVEHGFLGLLVQPLDPPAWYRKQNASQTDSALYDWGACHVFPSEVEELKETQEYYNAVN